MLIVRHSARQADDRHGRHRPPDPRGPVGPAARLPAGVPVQENRNPVPRPGPGRRRARLLVPAAGHARAGAPDDDRGRAQRPLRARPGAVRL